MIVTFYVAMTNKKYNLALIGADTFLGHDVYGFHRIAIDLTVKYSGQLLSHHHAPENFDDDGRAIRDFALISDAKKYAQLIAAYTQLKDILGQLTEPEEAELEEAIGDFGTACCMLEEYTENIANLEIITQNGEAEPSKTTVTFQSFINNHRQTLGEENYHHIKAMIGLK